MSGFATEWLALREPFDRAARDRKLLEALSQWARDMPLIHAVDLGAGTGSARRALAAHLPAGARWTLAEYDPLLVQAGQAQLEPGAAVAYRQIDLRTDLDALFSQRVDLLTASALIDLVSADWLDRLVGHIRRQRCAAWIGLTYDGDLAFEPPLPGDLAIVAAFNHDMGSDKGFGPALGADAHHALAERLAGHGRVIEGSSPWLLKERDQELITAMVDGIAGAASATPGASSWRAERRARTTAMRVGHRDLLFLP